MNDNVSINTGTLISDNTTINDSIGECKIETEEQIKIRNLEAQLYNTRDELWNCRSELNRCMNIVSELQNIFRQYTHQYDLDINTLHAELYSHKNSFHTMLIVGNKEKNKDEGNIS